MMSGWSWLGRSADVLQILAVVFSGYAALRLYRQSQQLKEIARALPPGGNFKELVKAYEGVKSSNPVAFAISLVRGSVTVKHSVQTFLDHKRWKMPIAELNMEGIKAVLAVISLPEDNVRYYTLCRGCVQVAEVFGGKPVTQRRTLYVV